MSSLEVFSSSLLKAFNDSLSAVLDKLNISLSNWNILSFDSVFTYESCAFPVFWSIFQVFFYYQTKIFDLSLGLIELLDLLLACWGWAKFFRYYFWWSTGWTASIRRTVGAVLFQILDVFNCFLNLWWFCDFAVLFILVRVDASVDLEELLLDWFHLRAIWNSVSSDNFLLVFLSVIFFLGAIELLDETHLNFQEFVWLLNIERSCPSL